MAHFTETQGRYLSFIHAYTSLHGFAPAESEIAAAMCVSPPSVNLMVKTLEKRGLISRVPGTARSIRVLVPELEIPSLHGHRAGRGPARAAGQPAVARSVPAATPANLYVFKVFLAGGPIPPEFANKEISRVIEIRGDQTLHQLHEAIFNAYERWDEHLYEFQFGRRPFDPDGPNYSVLDPSEPRPNSRDARTTTIDQLDLKPDRVFGYWFDFGDEWFHQIQLEKVDDAIPTVTYPRVIRRVGKSPPQYPPNDDEQKAGPPASRSSRVLIKPRATGKRR